ncbi:MAG: TIM barrel protein [Cyclobacteriaceae bacterium]|jgi:hydroxypyruvate isomerase|nr:TIM barrel protein [Cyclobacteriaceae bacterium]
MKRRNFLGKGLAMTAVPSFITTIARAENQTAAQTFKLNYAPHDGMFAAHAGNDFLDQIKFMHDQGFRAVEDNGMRQRTPALQEKIGSQLAKLGMTMGVFVAHNIAWNDANLASGNKEKRDQFLAEIKESVDVARRVNAKWMTVVPGALDKRLEMGYQTANVMEALRRACEILEPHNLVMVLEPLNPYRDHPGLFLARSPQAYALCKAVNSPSCKILFDIYHQQITEGNIIPNIDLCWDEIAYFQIGDNPGRNEPTTGELNYKNIFRHIYNKGFRGVMGMEHGNSIKGKEGEMAVINAYRECDSFK